MLKMKWNKQIQNQPLQRGLACIKEMTLNHGAITANIEWHCAILSPMGVQTSEDCYSLFCVRDNEELGKTYDHDSILTIHHTAYMEHHKPAVENNVRRVSYVLLA
jgi:hypothetical protein